MKKIIILFLILFTSFPAFALTGNTSANMSDNMQYLNIPFWEKFNDDILVDNLLAVYQNNNDLKAAVLKVNEAQRLVKMSFANELPHIGFEGYAGRIFKSSDEIFGDITIPDYTESHFLFPISMNYEVDIWGQNRLRTKAKKKQFEMIKQDEKAAYIYISSAFAADYFNLIRLDKLIDYQKELISLQEKIISSYKIRLDLGTATLSDIDREEKNLTFMKEDLKKLLEQKDILKNQMSTLLSDRSFDDIKRNTFENLNVNFPVPKSIDVKMLEQRPDRVKSELDLEKTGIDIKIAKRDLLPKFIITGNLGFNIYNISSSHKFLADIGVVPAWDLFLGGRKIQLLKMKKNTYDIAIQHYEKTILTSIQETNDALYSLKTAADIKTITNDRLNTDEKEMNYVKIKQEAGVADNLDMLFQKERLIVSKKQTVSSKINEIISAINLYQALGGVDFIPGSNL